MSEQDKSVTIKVTATPEWLAEQAVTGDGDGNVWLRWPNGIHLARVLRTNVHTESTAFLTGTYGVFGQTMRRWFVQHMESAYKAGVEAGHKQSLGDCQSWPAEVSAALRSAEETSRIARDEARQSCINDLAAALDAATPVARESLVREIRRLKAVEAAPLAPRVSVMAPTADMETARAKALADARKKRLSTLAPVARRIYDAIVSKPANTPDLCDREALADIPYNTLRGRISELASDGWIKRHGGGVWVAT